MRIICTTTFILFLFCELLLASEKPIESKIKNVTVFLQGAQITREASFTISAGNSTLVLNGLPSSLNPSSIQVEGIGGFTVLSVSHELDYQDQQENTERVNALLKEAESIRFRILELEGLLAAYQEEEKLLYENRKIGGVENGLAVTQLREAADFFRSRLQEINLKKLEVKDQIQNLREKEVGISKSLQEQKAHKRKPTSKVYIKIDASEAGKASLQLSYLVENAGWFPVYDLRVKEVGEPLELHYKAQVHQQSGEDWNKIQLVVSTANPEANLNKPEISTQWVNYQENVQWQDRRSYSTTTSQVQGRVTDASNGQPIPGTNVLVKGSTVGTVTDLNGNYSLSLPNAAKVLLFSFIGYKTLEVAIENQPVVDVALEVDISALEEVVVVGYGSKLEGRAAGVQLSNRSPRESAPVKASDVAQVQNQINTEFIINQPFTILSDGKVNMVDMQQHQIPVFYQYYSAPAKEEAAFLTAKITQWENVDLLAGEASLFFEGKYVGKTLVDPLQTQDTLEISLGKDKNVMVKREEVKDYNQSTFFGGKRKEERAYVISIRNAKQKPVQILLKDRIPVSKSSEITVETGELSGAKYASETGLIQWVLDVQPDTELEKKFSYSLRYNPKRKIVFYEN